MDTRPQSVSGPAVVALIATRGRFDLLRERALPSILAQTRVPDRLVIVADRTKEELPNRTWRNWHGSFRHSAAIGSRDRDALRHSGAKPAWNTGIDQLHRDAGIVRFADSGSSPFSTTTTRGPRPHRVVPRAAISRPEHGRSGPHPFGTLDPGHLHSIPDT